MRDADPFAEPEAYASLRREATALCAAVEPMAGEADEAETLHAGMAAALRESGLARATVPAAYGGRSESVDPRAVTTVREVLMGTSAHLDSLFGMQGVGSHALGVAGSPELREQWLPRVAALEALAALALTEPGTGSDLRNVSTTIRDVGDRLVVDGVKAFITNAGAAAFYTILGREGDEYSLVLVPADADGLRVVSGPSLIAPHILGEVRLGAVEVDASHRIGPPGAGFKLALATLAVFRVSVAGAAVGLAAAALEEATRHAMTREQFGAPLAKLGGVSQMLARSWVDVEAARAITYRAAAAARVDPEGALHLSSIAKVAATEAAGEVVDRCVQVMGRFGLVRGSKIERLYRNARPMRIYEGSTEVILDSLARRLQREVAGRGS